MAIVTAGALAMSAIGAGGAWAKQPKGPPEVTTKVVGSWVNEAGCVPIGLAPTNDAQTFDITCSGGSIWTGDFTGHTVVHLEGTVATSGAMSGTYTETFYGTYVPDQRIGSLTTQGTVTVGTAGEFSARAAIVSGTCGFAGSSGSMAYDGFALYGGSVGSWTHPAGPAPSGPCTPAAPPTSSARSHHPGKASPRRRQR